MEIRYSNQSVKFTRRPLYFHLPLRNISVEFNWTTYVIIDNRKNKILTLVEFRMDVRGRQMSRPVRLQFIRHIVVPSYENLYNVCGQRNTTRFSTLRLFYCFFLPPVSLAVSKRINTIHSVQDANGGLPGHMLEYSRRSNVRE